MKLLYNDSIDPAWNLACEEQLLCHHDEDVVMLWRNRPSIIIGKNQNALEEINLDFVRQHDLAVIRRLSGGGAVFHDLGNINFTFICAYEEGAFADYGRFTAPIRDYLRTLGLRAEIGGRNDILIDGKKISGNAQAVRNGRILSHGTLLYSADLSRLAGALKVDPGKIQSKGVKSVRSRVTNIAPLLKNPPETATFLQNLLDYFSTYAQDIRPCALTDDDRAAVDRLADEKYRTWDWNFSQSPAYNFARDERFPFGVVQVRMEVSEGVIGSIRLFGDYFGKADIAALEAKLTGVTHEPSAVAAALDGVAVGQYIDGLTADTLAALLF